MTQRNFSFLINNLQFACEHWKLTRHEINILNCWKMWYFRADNCCNFLIAKCKILFALFWLIRVFKTEHRISTDEIFNDWDIRGCTKSLLSLEKEITLPGNCKSKQNSVYMNEPAHVNSSGRNPGNRKTLKSVREYERMKKIDAVSFPYLHLCGYILPFPILSRVVRLASLPKSASNQADTKH